MELHCGLQRTENVERNNGNWLLFYQHYSAIVSSFCNEHKYAANIIIQSGVVDYPMKM